MSEQLRSDWNPFSNEGVKEGIVQMSNEEILRRFKLRSDTDDHALKVTSLNTTYWAQGGMPAPALGSFFNSWLASKPSVGDSAIAYFNGRYWLFSHRNDDQRGDRYSIRSLLQVQK